MKALWKFVICLVVLGGCSTSPQIREVIVYRDRPIPTPHVARVIDGDTVVLVNGDHVRFYGVDAPEHNLPGGKEATAFTVAFCNDKDVTLIGHGKDKYGRVLAQVMVNGQDTGQALLEAHLAVAYFGKARDPKEVSDTVEKWLQEHPIP